MNPAQGGVAFLPARKQVGLGEQSSRSYCDATRYSCNAVMSAGVNKCSSPTAKVINLDLTESFSKKGVVHLPGNTVTLEPA